MNALLDNSFTQHLSALGKRLPLPNAILAVSAHWETKGTFVATNPKPNTIYDFGGFPDELYKVTYPAPGAPDVAREVMKKVKRTTIHEDNAMGLDHGSWTVLKHIFPHANVPVFQLSLDYSMSPEQHYNLAKELKVLRNSGVMILGSGNIVHNLRRVSWSDPTHVYDWAREFDDTVRKNLQSRSDEVLVHYDKLGSSARLSIPSNEHYLPMLYTLGASDKKEPLQTIYESLEMGSISMRCFQIG
jgi:4,5-DOPA dioxygenase extradiol